MTQNAYVPSFIIGVARERESMAAMDDDGYLQRAACRERISGVAVGMDETEFVDLERGCRQSAFSAAAWLLERTKGDTVRVLIDSVSDREPLYNAFPVMAVALDRQNFPEVTLSLGASTAATCVLRWAIANGVGWWRSADRVYSLYFNTTDEGHRMGIEKGTLKTFQPRPGKPAMSELVPFVTARNYGKTQELREKWLDEKRRVEELKEEMKQKLADAELLLSVANTAQAALASKELTCIGCCIGRRQVVPDPCGHAVFCTPCFQLQSQQQRSTCSICRAHIYATIKLFL